MPIPIARLLLPLALLCQLGVTAAVMWHAQPPFVATDSDRWLLVSALPWLAAVAALARARLSRRTGAAVVLAAAALLQGLAVSSDARTSDDVIRYVWDGKVQLAGVDPYRYVPDDPALVRLHEPDLFRAAGEEGCVVPTGCARTNRPGVHTIYPPVAQAAFALVRAVTFGAAGPFSWHGGRFGFQLAGALGSLAVAVLLLRHRRGVVPPWQAALWAWCPIVVSEFGNNGHLDWLGVLLVVLGFGAHAAGRHGLTGLLVGAAVATKLYPGLVLPALLRPRPLRVVAMALAVLVVGYLPHVLAVGAGGVLGYLPGYLDEEGYSSGSRLLLLGAVVPQPWDTYVGGLVLAALALVCWRTTDPARPELGALWLTGAAFLVATPSYGWYAALLVVLIALTGRWFWLPVAFAPSLSYLLFEQLGRPEAHRSAAVAFALAWLVWLSFRRARPDTSRARSRRPEPVGR